jgi:branched-chain amino acid transport system substrate-binding protein
MRRILTCGLVVLAAVLAAGCEKKSSTQSPESTGGPATTGAPATGANAPVPSGDVILIGEVGSLTGAQATFGISTRNGVELAINEANAEGGVRGKKLAVRVYDDQSKPEEAANAATRLITQDHVKLIIGEVASTNSIAMAHTAQPAGVPMITPSSTNERVTAIGDYIFRVCFIDPFQGFVMAKFAKENLKVNRAAVLRDQKSDYSMGLADVFTRKFTEMGGKIVATESFAQGDTDFRSQLTSIRSSKPEAIYVPAYYSDVGIIARQARELGIKVPLLGGDGWESEKLWELGGSAVIGNYFSNHYSPEDPSPRVQNFIVAYKKAYGAVPDSLAALAYDAARVGIEAMKRAGSEDSKAIRDAIAATKDFPGVAGTITLDEKRNAIKPAVVVQVGETSAKYVATITP